MKQSMGVIVACVLGLFACNVEHYDECDDDSFDDFDERPTRPNTPGGSAGSDSSGTAGTTGSEGGASTDPDGSGGTAGTPIMEPPKVPCEKERDCAPGFNCNYDVNQCEPAELETCGELDLEADCAARTDCVPVYGGTNCSCGQDCECEGGEPGCICESFEFFVCRAGE